MVLYYTINAPTANEHSARESPHTLTMCPELGVNHVTGIHLEKVGAPGEMGLPLVGLSSLRSSVRTADHLVRSFNGKSK